MTLPHVEVGEQGYRQIVKLRVRRIVELICIGDDRLVFAEESVHPIPSGSDRQFRDCLRRWRRRRRPLDTDRETEVVCRAAVRSDHVGGELAQIVEQDGGLLVVVGVEQDAALLHEHHGEVPFRVEGNA